LSSYRVLRLAKHRWRHREDLQEPAAIYVVATTSIWILAVVVTSRLIFHHTFPIAGPGILVAADVVATSTWSPGDALGNTFWADTAATPFLASNVMTCVYTIIELDRNLSQQ
jgi:hypothetical protein